MPAREIIRPAGFPVPHPTFSPAIRYGQWLFVSGVMATDFENGLAAKARVDPNVPLAGEHALVRESQVLFEYMHDVLRAAGADLQNAVRIDQFPTSREMVDPYHIVRRDLIKSPRPASTSVVITGLMVPEANTEVELVCIYPQDGFRKEGVFTDKIPQPLGGYAPAIRAGDWIFVSGQVPSDFRTGLAPEARVDPNFWEGDAIDKQARFTLKNLALTLEAAGSSLDHVVHANVYLTQMSDLPRLDRVWREHFPNDPPARTIVPCRSIVVPDARIEITLVAVRADGKTKKEVVKTSKAPAPLFHESQAIRAGELVFLSGLLAADAHGLVKSARINPRYPYMVNSPAAQMSAIMENASVICDAAGTKLSNAVRMLTMHTDLREYAYAIEARRARFPDGQPAATTIGVPGPLQVPGCTVGVGLWVGVA